MQSYLFKVPFAMLIASLIFISCSKEDSQVFDEKSQEVDFTALEIYNQGLYGGQGNQTFGFWDSVGKIASIAGADIIGAGTGVWAVKEIGLAAGTFTGGTGTAIVYGAAAVICGGGASYYAARGFDSDNLDVIYIDYTIPSEYNFFDVGQYHNEVLDEVYYGSVTEEAFLYARYPENTEAIDYLYADEDYHNIYNLIITNTQNYIENSNSIFELIDTQFSSNLISADMKLFYSYFFEAIYNSNDIEELQNVFYYYSTHIEEENYTEHEKKSLFASISVAAHSFNYWSTKSVE